MKQIKTLFKNKNVLVGTVAVILLATVGTVFALNQPQTKNEVSQQETISDAEHEKLVVKMKELQESDKIAQVKAEEDKKITEEKPTVEQSKKEKVKQKEENKNTQPVQPQPKKEVKVEQKPVPKVGQSKPVVKPEAPKSLPKPPVASAKPKPKVEQPKEKKKEIVFGEVGNSGKIFKTEDEAWNWAKEQRNTFEKDELMDKKCGFSIAGFVVFDIEYSDGTFEYTVSWKTDQGKLPKCKGL